MASKNNIVSTILFVIYSVLFVIFAITIFFGGQKIRDKIRKKKDAKENGIQLFREQGRL